MLGTIAKIFVFGVAALVIGTAVIESCSTPTAPPTFEEVFGQFRPLEEPAEDDTADPSESPDDSPVSTPPVTMGMCATYDPVAHPEQILDILMLASSESCRVIQGQRVCTPVEILYAIWQKETGQVDGDGAGSGSYPVMAELERRDRDRGTKHAPGQLKMAEHFGWKETYGDGLERMTCSPPKRVPIYDPETGEKIGETTRGYGGCCGPFQFSAGEIADTAIAMNLDPLRFCGGAVLAAKDLLMRYEKAINKGHAHGYPAWRRAISSYYGSDPDSVYYSRALSKWEEFSDWQACEYRTGSDDEPSGWFKKDGGERCDDAALDRQWTYVRQQLVKKTKRSVDYFRALRE